MMLEAAPERGSMYTVTSEPSAAARDWKNAFQAARLASCDWMSARGTWAELMVSSGLKNARWSRSDTACLGLAAHAVVGKTSARTATRQARSARTVLSDQWVLRGGYMETPFSLCFVAVPDDSTEPLAAESVS